jgi:ketosteroid isomerase-like protein
MIARDTWARDTGRAMSQENADLLRLGIAAWNAGDMDALRVAYAPDIVMRPPEGWPESGPFVGIDAVMRQWEQQREIWNADSVEPISEFTHGGDYVAVRQVWHGTGSGPDTDMAMTNVIRVHEGKVIEQTFFRNHAEALEAVGLSE